MGGVGRGFRIFQLSRGFSFLHAPKYQVGGKNMIWFSICWLKSSDADGLGSFGAMLPTKAKEANVTSGDRTRCPRGDRLHGCSCDIPAGPFIQRRGPHQVIPSAEIATAISYMYPPKRWKSQTQFLFTDNLPKLSWNCKRSLSCLDK